MDWKLLLKVCGLALTGLGGIAIGVSNLGDAKQVLEVNKKTEETSEEA